MLTRAEQRDSAMPPRSRMRVVIADCDTLRRRLVRHLLLNHSGYELVGEADSDEQCADIVRREFPELAISSACCAPKLPQEPAFPLLITLASEGAVVSDRLVCDVPVPLREERLA